MDRITQRGDDDCQTAVCAMLADGWTYDELAEAYDTPMTMANIVHALRDDGLYYQLGRANNAYHVADLAHHLDRLYVTIESPLSERTPDLYHELTADDHGTGPSFSVLHAVAIRDGEVLDPKPDPYFTCWHDLVNSPYEVSSVGVFSEREPRALDFTPPDSDRTREY